MAARTTWVAAGCGANGSGGGRGLGALSDNGGGGGGGGGDCGWGVWFVCVRDCLAVGWTSGYEPWASSLETSSRGRCRGGVRVFTDLSSPHGEAPSFSRSRLASCGDVPELIVHGGVFGYREEGE